MAVPLSLLQTNAVPPVRMGPVGPDLVGYLLTCGFVLALVLGAAWLLRRFLSGTLRTRAAQRALKVVDVLPLGGRQRLVVVRCYDRTFLLGQGEKEVRAISELDSEDAQTQVEAAPRVTEEAPGETAQARRAASAFARILGRKSAGNPAQELADTAAPGPVQWVEAALPSPTAREPEDRPERPVLDGGKGILG